MNLIKFPVGATNIFPIANTLNGGQLVTEYNLRSRESVFTNESVQYFIGPSYVHSQKDFEVSVSAQAADYFNSNTSSSELQISAGRGVINGHYVELLTPITIDMSEAVHDAVSLGDTPLQGKLSIGLKAMYSTEKSLSGSILTDNNEEMYEGIQVVILPSSEFILPTDSPDDQNAVKAHILLATFKYYNGSISDVQQNLDKCRMIDASRIGNLEGILSDDYVTKSNLNAKRFYVMAGKYTLDEQSMEWCDATNSMMVWSIGVPDIVQTEPAIRTARFDRSEGSVDLVVPHKQIDGMAESGEFYAPIRLPIPEADYDNNIPGVVGSAYHDVIKALKSQVDGIYNIPRGQLKFFLDELQSMDNLPSLDQTTWSVGDYVVVAQDYTVNYTLQDSSRKPSTMYFVLGGYVRSINPYSAGIHPTGVELASFTSSDAPTADVPNNPTDYWDIYKYRGRISEDYFTYIYKHNGEEQKYYYTVRTVTDNGYSNPVFITGGVPLAEESVVGGFLNVPENVIDEGYVRMDSKGYLKLVDYDLLRAGTLAYQLGEDYTVPNGLTLEQIQAYLDEYVNQRIVFPNQNQLKISEPNRINVYVEISDTEAGTLNFYELDSRFNTSVCLHITVPGDKNVNVTINVADCERVQIDPAIINYASTSNITMNVYRSNIYYDADVFDFVTKMQDIGIWYERFTSNDPILSVEGMTVSQMMYNGQYSENNVDSITDWSSVNVNDYHFDVVLQSITFNADGDIDGCGVLVRNKSTSNAQFGKHIIHDSFILPQGPNLLYPKYRMPRQIKVTGEFISAYSDVTTSVTVQNTYFSLLTQKYLPGAADEFPAGDIEFLVDSYDVSVTSSEGLRAWDSDRFHYFSGKTAY